MNVAFSVFLIGGENKVVIVWCCCLDLCKCLGQHFQQLLMHPQCKCQHREQSKYYLSIVTKTTDLQDSGFVGLNRTHFENCSTKRLAWITVPQHTFSGKY